ncbi:MAG: hypothetical protein Q4A97_09850 [Comamonadaceae bacterium]|nr:hypothetical protein [Comamonadaceae bacterium]
MGKSFLFQSEGQLYGGWKIIGKNMFLGNGVDRMNLKKLLRRMWSAANGATGFIGGCWDVRQM